MEIYFENREFSKENIFINNFDQPLRICLNLKPGPKFWYQNKNNMPSIVKTIKAPVKILSGNVTNFGSGTRYFCIVLAIKSRCCTSSNSSSMPVLHPPANIPLDFPSLGEFNLCNRI